MSRLNLVACILSVAFVVSAAFGQTPLPGQKGAAPGAASRSGAAPSSGSRAVSLIAPALAPADSSRQVTGRIGAFALDRVNTAAATSAAMVPTAPRWAPVTIVNRVGGRAAAVDLDDIGLIEDGVRQKVVSIERWPLWLTIVLDVGRQVGPIKQLALHRQLVYDLLYALGEDDHVSIVQYADGVNVIQPWTRDRAEAERAVEAKFESGLEGQLWDSVDYAAGTLLADKLGHRVVVVITDGVDDAGRDASYTRALATLEQTASTLYIVNLSRYLAEHIRREAYGVNGLLNVIQSPSYIGRRKELRQYAERIEEAPKQMVQATEESGGKIWLVAPEEDPTLLPQFVWQQIEGQYMVSYVPERVGDSRSTRPVREMSAFVTRGDIVVRTPRKLFVPIVSPRSAPTGTPLRQR